MTEENQTPPAKKKKGFAVMDPEEQREIARLGGRAAHAKKTAHRFTVEEARAAGRVGGKRAHQMGRGHQYSHDEAVEAGRKGGLARAAKDREATPEETPVLPPPAPLVDEPGSLDGRAG